MSAIAQIIQDGLRNIAWGLGCISLAFFVDAPPLIIAY